MIQHAGLCYFNLVMLVTCFRIRAGQGRNLEVRFARWKQGSRCNHEDFLVIYGEGQRQRYLVGSSLSLLSSALLLGHLHNLQPCRPTEASSPPGVWLYIAAQGIATLGSFHAFLLCVPPLAVRRAWLLRFPWKVSHVHPCLCFSWTGW